MSETKDKQAENTIAAGYTLDYISGKQIKESAKEGVRQKIVRALIHEYGFSPEDMENDFSLGGRKKVDVAIFHQGLESIGERLIAKSLDDRIGCAILIETLRRLKQTPHEIYFVFSVQEEITSVGARTAAYSIDPDIAIAVDVTGTGDTPRAQPMAVEMGKGPAIKVRDAGMIADPRVKNWMVQRAEAAKIPYQLEIFRLGTTDVQVVQTVREGVPSGGVLVPARYVHSQAEMIDLGDVEQTVKLLVELLKKPIVMRNE